MRYRIIQRGDGKFQVQKKILWICDWQTVRCYIDDYPVKRSDTDDEDFFNDTFSTLDLANMKLNKSISDKQHEELKKKFKVIEEVSV